MRYLIGVLAVFLASQCWAEEGILDPLIKLYEGRGGVVADFVQEVEVKTPHRVMRRKGRAYFKSGGLMRWDYQWPSRVYYLSDGRYFWMYDVEEGTVYRMGLGKSPLYAVLGVLFDASKVYESFNVQLVNRQEDGTVRVKLIPKNKAPLKYAFLVFNNRTGLVKEVEIIDNVDTKSRITFKDQRFQDLPKEVFTMRIPKGIKVQDLDRER